MFLMSVNFSASVAFMQVAPVNGALVGVAENPHDSPFWHYT